MNVSVERVPDDKEAHEAGGKRKKYAGNGERASASGLKVRSAGQSEDARDRHTQRRHQHTGLDVSEVPEQEYADTDPGAQYDRRDEHVEK
jgi:hypothetical protein